MDIEKKQAEIIWRCRRGMLELDLLLHQFIQKQLPMLTAQQLQAFENLLSWEDPLLYEVLINHADAPQKELNEIVQLIQLSY